MNHYFAGPRSYDNYLDTEDLRNLRKFYDSFPKNQVVHREPRMLILNVNYMYVLYSYSTHVATIKNSELFRRWYGWSATTSKHLKTFCNMFGVHAPNKAEWEKMNPVAINMETGEVMH